MDERIETATPVCYRHPDRPTRLHCTECERPICVECSRDAAVGQKCPECAAPQGRHRVVDARQALSRPGWQSAPVAFGFIAAAVLFYLLGDRAIEWFALFSPFVNDGELWRLFTVVLVHGGITHILFNMYALYLFGPMLERQVGSVPFTAMYLATAAVGSAVSVIFGPPNQLAVGASGAIFGLFGAWLFVAYRVRTTAFGRAMFNQLMVLLAINLALPLFIPRIDWRAHLGGLVGGVVIAWLWNKLAVGREQAETIRTVIAALVAVLAVVAVVVL